MELLSVKKQYRPILTVEVLKLPMDGPQQVVLFICTYLDCFLKPGMFIKQNLS